MRADRARAMGDSGHWSRDSLSTCWKRERLCRPFPDDFRWFPGDNGLWAASVIRHRLFGNGTIWQCAWRVAVASGNNVSIVSINYNSGRTTTHMVLLRWFYLAFLRRKPPRRLLCCSPNHRDSRRSRVRTTFENGRGLVRMARWLIREPLCWDRQEIRPFGLDMAESGIVLWKSVSEQTSMYETTHSHLIECVKSIHGSSFPM